MAFRGLGTPLSLAVALSMGAQGVATAAECVPPAPPPVSAKPAKPVLPAKSPCVDAKAGTAGCMGWEAYQYNDAIKAYNAQLAAWKPRADAYVKQLNDFVQKSAEYARCEVQSLQ